METSNFDKTLESIAELGLQAGMPMGVSISINKDFQTSAQLLCAWMKHFLGERPLQRHEAYKDVARWLTNNEGKGLFLYGYCSQGKTLLSRYVLPAMLHHYCNKVVHFYTMTEANQKLDEVLGYHCLSIDDVGVEEQMVQYGQRRNAFDEIMDAAEKKGKLVIITTNLNKDQIIERYGTRTYERIKATTLPVKFGLTNEKGEPISFRY